MRFSEHHKHIELHVIQCISLNSIKLTTWTRKVKGQIQSTPKDKLQIKRYMHLDNKPKKKTKPFETIRKKHHEWKIKIFQLHGNHKYGALLQIDNFHKWIK